MIYHLLHCRIEGRIVSRGVEKPVVKVLKTTITTSHMFKILYLPVKGFDRLVREAAVIDPAGTVFLDHYKRVDVRITEPWQEAGKFNKDLLGAK